MCCFAFEYIINIFQFINTLVFFRSCSLCNVSLDNSHNLCNQFPVGGCLFRLVLLFLFLNKATMNIFETLFLHNPQDYFHSMKSLRVAFQAHSHPHF